MSNKEKERRDLAWLKKTYEDPKHPAGFSSYTELRKHASKIHISDATVKSFLQGEEAYTLHAPTRKKFKRNSLFVTNIDDVWFLDTMDVQKFKSQNKNVRYILVAVDGLSRYAWVRMMRDKKGSTTKDAIQDIFDKSKRTPGAMCVDKGTEFYARPVLDYLKSKEVTLYSTENSDIKSFLAERFIRTLKQKMWRYFSYTGTHKYIDVLQDIVSSYNGRVHATTKQTPSSVNETNFLSLWRKLYGSQKYMNKEEKPKLKNNDFVIISKTKNSFSKGYENNWSIEIFKIKKILRRDCVLYEISDLNNEPIKGRFYAKELQLVTPPELYKIDKILGSKGTGSSKAYLVRWKGYDPTFDSYVAAKDIKKFSL
jgi:hypothetical protein